MSRPDVFFSSSSSSSFYFKERGRFDREGDIGLEFFLGEEGV
jgi:hypothetical protein